MKFNISAKKIELTGELKQKLEDKIHKELHNHINDESAWADLKVSDLNGSFRKGNDKRVRLIVKLPGKTVVKIEETADNVDAAIEMVKDRIARSLNKVRERKRDAIRRISKEKLNALWETGLEVGRWSGKVTRRTLSHFSKKKK